MLRTGLKIFAREIYTGSYPDYLLLPGLIEINQLVFIENQIQGLELFKTEYNNYLYNIYCTHDFKTLIEDQGLKGLLFSSDLTNSPE